MSLDDYAKRHGLDYESAYARTQREKEEKRQRLNAPLTYNMYADKAAPLNRAVSEYERRKAELKPDASPWKRLPSAAGLGLLKGTMDLADKINLFNYAPTVREVDIAGFKKKGISLNIPVLQPNKPAGVYSKQVDTLPYTDTTIEGLRKRAELKGTIAEAIMHGIGHETPAIVASYGGAGQLTKIPKIGEWLVGSGKALETGRRGVAAGAMYTPIAEESPTATDYLENMALFGAGDMAFTGIAHGIGRGVESIKGAKRGTKPPTERSSSLDYLFEEGTPEVTRVEPDFTATPYGVYRGGPRAELPGAPEQLALPGGERRLALPGGEQKALPPGQDFNLSEGYPVEGHWFVDPYGVARGEPGMPLALPEGKTGQGSRFGGYDEGQIPRSDIGDPAYLAGLEKQYNDVINAEVASMKNELGGVETIGQNGYEMQPGQMLFDGYKRVSKNPSWYREFWQKNSRAPREGELRDLAIKNLMEGNRETGEPANAEFLAIMSELSRGQKLPEEWHGLQRTIRDLEGSKGEYVLDNAQRQEIIEREHARRKQNDYDVFDDYVEHFPHESEFLDNFSHLYYKKPYYNLTPAEKLDIDSLAKEYWKGEGYYGIDSPDAFYGKEYDDALYKFGGGKEEQPSDIDSLLADMRTEQGKVEPYGLTRDMGRLSEAENAYRGRMEDKADFGQYEGVKFKAAETPNIDYAPIFYSQLQRVIEQKMPNRATPEQIKGILGKGAVKEEELKWADLDGFLEGKQKVTKQEVLDYLRQNDVQVEEVTPSGNRYESYTLPGGENYRELLLTLPGAKPLNWDNIGKIMQKHDIPGDFAPGEHTDDVALRIINEYGSRLTKQEFDYLSQSVKTRGYTSSHWDEPNVLAHVRFNDRTGANGEKVLHIEEVQSDWHQEGRRKGYSGEIISYGSREKYTIPRGWAFATDTSGKYYKNAVAHLLKNSSGDTMGVGTTKSEAIRKAESDGKFQQSQLVPDAPFKNTWHELTMKRMIRYAAENDYDRISWTTGEQQAARYDLSKQIKELHYKPSAFVKDSYTITCFDNNGKIVFDQPVKKDKLPETVGKEVAEKILNKEGRPYGGSNENDNMIISGLDLQVGGEGMKGFYDRMIPSWLNKYAKKWGARVEGSEVGGRKELKPYWEPDNNNLPEWLDEGYKFEYETKDGDYNKVGIYFSKEDDAWYAFKDGTDIATMVSREEAEMSAINAAKEDMNPEELLGDHKGVAVHSIPVTKAMRDSVLYEGQPKFKYADSTAKKAVGEANQTLGLTRGDKDRITYAADGWTPEMELADKAANALSGTGVIPVKMPSFMDKFQGFFEATNRKIFVNKNTKDPITYVAYHETGHRMKETHPEHYARIEEIALNNLKEEHSGLIERYSKRGYATDEMPEEFTSDLIAEMLHDKSFIGKLREQAPEVIKPLLDILDEVITKVKLALGKDDSVLPYIENLEKLRNELSPEYASYLETVQGERMAAAKYREGWGKAAKVKGETVPEAADNINTPEFRKWFGDSKVVDDNGKPLVVYHGSPGKTMDEAPFSAFDNNPEVFNPQETKGSRGFYFTNKRNVAEEYAGTGRGGGYTYDTHLSIKNPLDLTKPETLKNVLDDIGMGDLFDKTRVTDDYYAPGYYLQALEDIEGGLSHDVRNKIVEYAQENGYDGMLLNDLGRNGDYVSYVAFSPTQIKSVYNRGTWDPTNPDIRFKLGEGGKSPIDDLKAMVEYGANRFGKVNYEHFARQMQKQFPDELAGYSPEITDRLMKDVYIRAKELNSTGKTQLEFSGQVVNLSKGGQGKAGIARETETPVTEPIANNLAGEQGIPAPQRNLPEVKQGELLEGLDVNPNELKDISGTQAGWRDMWRNMQDVFGEKFDAVKARILDPLEDAKASWVDHQRELTDRLNTDIVEGLGIEKNSRESELVQLYGEGGYRHWEAIPKNIAKNEQGINSWLARLEKKHGKENVEFTGDGAEINKPFDYNDLVREVGAERAADIVQAENWFRQVYDNLIDQVNEVRRQIYPYAEGKLAEIDARIEQIKTDKTLFPDVAERRAELDALEAQRETFMQGKLVPKRNDYFRHFREMEGVEGIQNLFDTSAQISPELAGKSMYTRPKSKFHGFMQQRGMGEYKPDAVGGILDYIPSATYAIHIDPQGAAFRQLERELVDTMGNNTGINKFLEYLKYYADDIQGKTNFFDRNLQFLTDRKVFKGLVQLNNRIKGNVILGNAGTMVSQVFNIPQGLAFTKQHSGPGLTRYLSSALERHSNPEAFMANNPMAQSRFLKERYSGDMYRRFATKLGEKAKNVAVVGMEDVDRFATEYIWNSCYEKALNTKGISDPIRYADLHARRLVAGRGIGEVPLMQKSKLIQMIAPFQVEVGNLWSVMGDMRRDKDWGAFVILPLALWLFNEGSERLRGSGVALDPIQAIQDSVEIAQGNQDNKALRVMGRMAGEVLSNVPLGQTAATMFFDENQRKQFFGREDPTRYGSSVLVAKGMQDPIFKIAMPFGGLQAEKTLKGIDTLAQGGSYDKEGKLRYPISTDPINAVKGLTFGSGGFRETRGYYEEGGKPLSEKQTAEYERKVSRGQDKEKVYSNIQRKRKLKSLRSQMQAIRRDKGLTGEEKRKKIKPLEKELKKVRAGN